MKDYIVGLGEILFDCLPTGKKLGGAPANFAYHVSQFGLNGIAVSAIGDDADGSQVRSELAPRKMLSHLEVVDFPTGTVQVTLDDKGIPQYDICLGVAYDNIPWTPAVEEIAKNTRAVCFGSLAQRSPVTRETVQKFLDTMPSEGTLKVFDINLRQSWYSREVIEESLRRSNVLKLNDDEILVLASLLELGEISLADGAVLRLADCQAQCKLLMERYDLQMLILTCGVNGSFVFSRDGSVSYQETPVVEVVDTVGAGDSFTGSFCAAILAGKSIEQAHATGVQVSAFVCTRAGAMPEYPEELLALGR